MRPFILISLGLGLSACTAANGDEAIFIQHNIAPPAMGCSFSSMSNEPYIPHGRYAMWASDPFFLYPQMVSKITSMPAMIEQRTIQARAAKIDIETTEPALSGISGDGITHFESRFSSAIAPNGGVTDTFFEAIPLAFVEKVRAAKNVVADSKRIETEVILHVRITGDLDGNEVTSQEWQYPVTLTTDMTFSMGACPLAVGTLVPVGANPCDVFQENLDGSVGCCTMGTELVCPGTVAIP